MNPETERVHASFPFTVTFCFSDHIYSHLPSSRYIILCGLRLLLLVHTNSWNNLHIQDLRSLSGFTVTVQDI